MIGRVEFLSRVTTQEKSAQVERTMITDHHDMTEKLLKATLNPNTTTTMSLFMWVNDTVWLANQIASNFSCKIK